ncbi:MerR family transcriptional regulator [Francisella philomiragia]|uniref:MerR family transcriptional regulator n=1 Tax=Francisella philomiragia TaxID=28110 RepID=UPI001C9DB8F3|nr:MerR family transcriptional regulator [Francisella philomiragia]MBY7734957.1 MerR family transcriptional regulator [Francisella philomiragia]
MQWYTKEISRLTNVSVKTLHHYDSLGLLVPVRNLNGYRIYTEKDLLKLQNIIVVKSFGFNLKQIKQILDKKLDIKESFILQLNTLKKQKDQLEKLIIILSKFIERDDLKPFDISKVFNMIKESNMSEVYENSLEEVLNDLEKQQYNQLKQEKKITEEVFNKRWKTLCEEISLNLEKDPYSEYGIKMGERIHAAVYNLYGRRYAGLKHTVWNKGFMTGKFESSIVTEKVINWIDKAMQAYFTNRLRSIFIGLENKQDSLVAEQFGQLLDEMFGNEDGLKLKFFEQMFNHKEVPEKTKKWVKQNQKIFL